MAVEGVGNGSIGIGSASVGPGEGAQSSARDSEPPTSGTLGTRSVRQVHGGVSGSADSPQSRAVQAFKLGLKGLKGVASVSFSAAKVFGKLGIRAVKLAYDLSTRAAKSIDAYQKAHSQATPKSTFAETSLKKTAASPQARPSSLELHVRQEAPVAPKPTPPRPSGEGVTPERRKAASSNVASRKDDAKSRADKYAELTVQKQNVERLKAQLKSEGAYFKGDKGT